jgi:hypothetical protein
VNVGHLTLLLQMTRSAGHEKLLRTGGWISVRHYHGGRHPLISAASPTTQVSALALTMSRLQKKSDTLF